MPFSRPKLRRAGVALLVAISAASVWASDVQAQCAGTSCVVTTNADTLAGAGTSLRDAITYANAHPGTADELLLGPARTVVLERALSPSRETVRIERAAFGAESGMIGAAAFAFEGIDHPVPA